MKEEEEEENMDKEEGLDILYGGGGRGSGG